MGGQTGKWTDKLTDGKTRINLISRANNFQRITEPAAAVREASAILKILNLMIRESKQLVKFQN